MISTILFFFFSSISLSKNFRAIVFVLKRKSCEFLNFPNNLFKCKYLPSICIIFIFYTSWKVYAKGYIARWNFETRWITPTIYISVLKRFSLNTTWPKMHAILLHEIIIHLTIIVIQLFQKMYFLLQLIRQHEIWYKRHIPRP